MVFGIEEQFYIIWPLLLWAGLKSEAQFAGDYDVYLALVRSCAQRFGVDLLGYSPLTRRIADLVHWVVALH